MNKIIEKFRKSSYLLQIITLMTGTLVAQIIMLLFIPILTRLYTPSEFGLYSLFFAIASMVGMVSSFSYEQAIMLPKSNRDAEALVFLSIIISIAISITLALVLMIFYNLFLDYFEGMSYMIWLLPFATLAIGLMQIFDAYSTRKEFYKKIATTKMSASIATVSIQSITRYIFSLNGLVIGKMLSDIFALSLLISYHIKKQTLQLKYLSKRRLGANIKRHENFPKYQTASTLINSFSQNVPLFMFTALFSPAISGFYALTYRAMQTPMLLVSSATRSVYYQKASKMYANGDDIYPLYKKTTLGLVKLFIVPFFIILIFGQEIFSLVFGSSWVESGLIAQISIVWFAFSFISPPTTTMFNIYNLQKMRLIIQVSTLLIRVLVIYIGFYFYQSYIVSLALFVIVGVLHNSGVMIYIYLKIRENRRKI
jgi:O-antigen/teichoic acid export membrane protein